MKRISKNKKGAGLLLLAGLTALLGLAPTLGNIREAKAAEQSTKTEQPSVTAYADVDTLTSDIFTPKYKDDGSFDSDNTAVAKLKFGKNDEAKAQEWYILGPDKNISGSTDNIVIFAADDIKHQTFNVCDHDYEGDDDEEYVKGVATPSETPVASNHYGESEIREELRKMADESDSDYDYFTKAEKILMQKTKVLTHEYDNKNRLYTTNDKLYLASGIKNLEWNTGVIYVGDMGDVSDENMDVSYEYTGKALLAPTYWMDGVSFAYFWIRSPDESVRYSGSGAFLQTGIIFCGLSIGSNHYIGVRPASNLNLSTVLFASAAQPVQHSETPKYKGEIISSDTAMTLRLDGSSQKIGTIALKHDDAANENVIAVTKGSEAADDVNVVVQGKNPFTGGTTESVDWYFSKRLDESSDTITLNDIINSFGTSESGKLILTSDELAECKMWLEMPVESGSSTLAYAVTTDMTPTHTHEYDGKWTSDEYKHWHQCKDGSDCPDLPGSIKDEDYHVFGDDNVCDTCEYVFAEPHKLVKTEKAATCKDVGYKVHYECTHCEKWFEYPIPTTGNLVEITDKSEYEIPKLTTHTPGSSYSHNLKKHWRVCQVCGARIDEEAHSFENNKCTVCGYEKSSGGGNSSGSSSSESKDSYNNTNGTWEQDNKGWRYKLTDGQYAKGSKATDVNGSTVDKILWLRINDKEYAFGSDTYLMTGWVYDTLSGKWYYCDENNGKLTGWFYDKDAGYWYYLNPATGEMLSGWQRIDGKEYYLAQTPASSTYTFDEVLYKWVYNNEHNHHPYGSMYVNTTTPDNHRVNADGVKTE